MLSNIINGKTVKDLTASLSEMTKDRDAQMAKVKDLEEQIKASVDAAQSHQSVLDSIKADYEAKLAAKETELASLKESKDKEISTVKESVASETIRLVASQGTNVVIPTESKVTDSAQALWEQYKGMRKNSPEANEFYAKHRSLFAEMRNQRTK